MKTRLSIFFIGIVFCSCSSTNLVFISVQQPAPVTLPPNAHTVAVVNRTQASQQTKVIDVVDKVFSMEGAKLDKDAAAVSITGLTDELTKNNRFTEIKPVGPVLSTNTPNQFPAPLSWQTVDEICGQNIPSTRLPSIRPWAMCPAWNTRPI
jgi:hypothetical protein